jgi:hypothetical protein
LSPDRRNKLLMLRFLTNSSWAPEPYQLCRLALAEKYHYNIDMMASILVDFLRFQSIGRRLAAFILKGPLNGRELSLLKYKRR